MTALTALTPSSLPFDIGLLAGTRTQNTLEAYESDFERYMAFVTDHGLEPIQPRSLVEYRSYLVTHTDKSPNTINRYIASVKSLMAAAYKLGYIDRITSLEFGDIDGVRMNALADRTKDNARTRITPAQMRSLTACPGTDTLKGLRDTAILHTLASTGLRCMELATLRVDKIRQDGRGFLVSVRGKNESEYTDAYLSVTAYNAIQAWLEARSVSSPFVFIGFDGRGNRENDDHISDVGVWKLVQRYADECGLLHIKPHDFRRFVGTELAHDHGIRKAQKALRHKSIETTARHYVLDELEPGLTDNLY